jgi:BON domain
MKNIFLSFVSLAIAATALVLPHAFAQPSTPPNDWKLIHDVQAVLQNEKAFRGLTIIPKISHGTVTLTGTVSSEGDKVLAGLEVGNVNGVKTVINDLAVKPNAATQGYLPALSNPNGAKTEQLTTVPPVFPSPAPASNLPAEKTITVPANTSIQVRITDPLTSKTAKPNDPFHGTVAAAVFTNGAVAIPAGTPVLGRVVSAKSAGHFLGSSQMSLQLTSIRLPHLDGTGRDIPIVTQYLTNNSQARGGNLTPAAQIEIKPQTVLTFLTQAPFLTTIWVKNGTQANTWVRDGTQIQLPAAPGLKDLK